MDRLPERTETERLVLRRLTPEDEPTLSAAITANLEHLRPWMIWIADEPVSATDRLELLATWEREWLDGGDLISGLFLDGDYIGNIGLHRRGSTDCLEIGYWVDVDHTGRGYITEAGAALADLAFAQPGIERITVHHDRANVASRAVPDRLGFTLQREVAKAIHTPGETGIECQWEVNRDDWIRRTSGAAG